jgi:hypothetical protein
MSNTEFDVDRSVPEKKCLNQSITTLEMKAVDGWHCIWGDCLVRRWWSFEGGKIIWDNNSSSTHRRNIYYSVPTSLRNTVAPAIAVPVDFRNAFLAVYRFMKRMNQSLPDAS